MTSYGSPPSPGTSSSSSSRERLGRPSRQPRVARGLPRELFYGASARTSSPAGRISPIRSMHSSAYRGPASTRFAGPPEVAATGPNTGRLGFCVAATRNCIDIGIRERIGAVARCNGRNHRGPRGLVPSQRAVASFATTRWGAGQPAPKSSVRTVSSASIRRALYAGWALRRRAPPAPPPATRIGGSRPWRCGAPAPPRRSQPPRPRMPPRSGRGERTAAGH